MSFPNVKTLAFFICFLFLCLNHPRRPIQLHLHLVLEHERALVVREDEVTRRPTPQHADLHLLRVQCHDRRDRAQRDHVSRRYAVVASRVDHQRVAEHLPETAFGDEGVHAEFPDRARRDARLGDDPTLIALLADDRHLRPRHRRQLGVGLDRVHRGAHLPPRRMLDERRQRRRQRNRRCGLRSRRINGLHCCLDARAHFFPALDIDRASQPPPVIEP